MSKKKILFIHYNHKSYYIRDLALEFIKFNNGEYDVLLYNPVLLSKYKFDVFSHEFILTKSKDYKNSFIDKLRSSKLGRFLSTRQAFLEGQDSYESITLHACSLWCFPLRGVISEKANKTIAVIWGSDFYGVKSNFVKYLLGLIYKTVDKIVVGSENSKRDFLKQYPAFSEKSIAQNFGNKKIPHIDVSNIQKKKLELKKEYSINSEKIVFCIGHKAELEQQHHKVIDAFLSLDKDVRDRVHLLLPMTYPNNTTTIALRKQIKDTLDNNSFSSYTILDKFVPTEKVADIRILSDMYINARTTDMFSAATMEHLYTQNVVLIGDWVATGQAVKEMNCEVSLFKWDDLKKSLQAVISNFDVYKNKSIKNQKIIFNTISWTKISSKWSKILKADS